MYGRCINDGSILLTRLSPLEPDEGKWTLPGGGMEPGESVHQTLRREFDEETGLVPEIGRLVDVFTRTHPANERRGPLEVVQHVYEVTAVGEPHVREVGGSTAAAAWVSLADLDRLALVDLVHWALSRR